MLLQKTLTNLTRKIGWDPTDHPGMGSYCFNMMTPIPMQQLTKDNY
jgi:hypothetical protein